MKKYYYLALVLFSFFASSQEGDDKKAIAQTLDSFHQAAAQANAKKYLTLLTENAVFLGTDGSERWNKKEFSAFVEPYFKQGKGWLYLPEERNISLLEQGRVAFFDEVLFNKKYGRCRGSGVLVKTPQGWKISQYNLTILVPNDVADQVIEKINEFEQKNNDHN